MVHKVDSVNSSYDEVELRDSWRHMNQRSMSLL